MSIFGKKEARYLGVDIGSASIKLVELVNVRGIPELSTYGLAELPLSATTVEPEKVAAVVREACDRAKVRATNVVTSLPTHSVFTAIINVPKLAKADFQAVIKNEAAKLMPLPVDDMILDPQIIGSDAGGTVKVLVVGAPKSLVMRYVTIFEKAKLKLLSLETESFAMIRSLVGKDMSPLMIMDVGSSTTDLIVVDGNAPVMNRTIAISGSHVTNSFAKTMGISSDAAEQLKRGLALSGAVVEIPVSIKDLIEPISTEAKEVVNLFRQTSGKNIEKVILTGGSAILNGLADHLAQVFKVRVFVGDPWARVRYPLELRASLTESATRFSIAVGLAMRDIK